MGTDINTNVLLTRCLAIGKIFILLLITMAMLFSPITKAKTSFDIQVLSATRTEDEPDSLCNNWNLNETDVKAFFETAKLLTNSAEMNIFDIYPCNVSGFLISSGVEWKYNINLGGYAVWFNSDKSIGFGCREGECLNYVDYEPYSDGEDEKK